MLNLLSGNPPNAPKPFTPNRAICCPQTKLGLEAPLDRPRPLESPVGRRICLEAPLVAPTDHELEIFYEIGQECNNVRATLVHGMDGGTE